MDYSFDVKCNDCGHVNVVNGSVETSYRDEPSVICSGCDAELYVLVDAHESSVKGVPTTVCRCVGGQVLEGVDILE